MALALGFVRTVPLPLRALPTSMSSFVMSVGVFQRPAAASCEARH